MRLVTLSNNHGHYNITIGLRYGGLHNDTACIIKNSDCPEPVITNTENQLSKKNPTKTRESNRKLRIIKNTCNLWSSDFNRHIFGYRPCTQLGLEMSESRDNSGK